MAAIVAAKTRQRGQRKERAQQNGAPGNVGNRLPLHRVQGEQGRGKINRPQVGKKIPQQPKHHDDTRQVDQNVGQIVERRIQSEEMIFEHEAQCDQRAVIRVAFEKRGAKNFSGAGKISDQRILDDRDLIVHGFEGSGEYEGIRGEDQRAK